MNDKLQLPLPLSPQQLATTAANTLDDYAQRAADFWEGTKGHDVSQNVSALLRHLDGDGPFDILDFGCGPGRDLLTFKRLGHRPVGLDGCEEFVAMAQAHSDSKVMHQDFLALDLPLEGFDGVFANASLFHVPSQELARVLQQIHHSLRPGGVFFSSNPRGPNIEGYNGACYCTYLNLERYRDYLKAAGFEELEHYFRPAGKPRSKQPWLASIWRKTTIRGLASD